MLPSGLGKQSEEHDIVRVNPTLPADLHPVEVREWFTRPEPGLSIGSKGDRAVSPIEWLDTGGDPARAVALARRL